MAISYKRPIKIGSADAGATMVYDKPIKVTHVQWVSLTGTPGDRAVIQDRDGNTLWESIVSGPNFDSGRQQIMRWWPDGFKVPTLASGTLYVDYI
jgi:hypothetical protein